VEEGNLILDPEKEVAPVAPNHSDAKKKQQITAEGK
jgi:hypothetical protein